MPRKPKFIKQKMTVITNGVPIVVSLTPPSGVRTSWYAYWDGLVASKSTGTSKLEEAVLIAESMVKNGGHRTSLRYTVLSDEELKQIQRVHFARKQDTQARVRAEKTLKDCLEAISAFQAISKLTQTTLATADDCAAFQRKALKLAKNWRQQYPNGKKEGVERMSPNTVVKWSRQLQAAFERANKNSRKCVRGVVEGTRLLTENPWKQFDWVEGIDRPKRRFDNNELLSVLDYFETEWPQVISARLLAKVSLWTWTRISEVSSLRWAAERRFGDEIHFEFVGKWGVKKWARIPAGLHVEILAIKTGAPYVFAAYSEELRTHHLTCIRPGTANSVGKTFSPSALADWFQDKIGEWSDTGGKSHATPHVFRKTALQHARRGEDLNRQVAQDARLSESVMMGHYVDEDDEQLRQASNRTFVRILASLSLEVAARYGHDVNTDRSLLVAKLRQATEAQDWELVRRLAIQLDEQFPRLSRPAQEAS